MSFFDKAKNKITKVIPKNFGEKTLDSYDEENEEYVPPTDTVFTIEEDPFEGLTYEGNEEQTPVLDILEALEIPETFEIDDSIYLAEDFDDITFDQQHIGYDMSQVDLFYVKARKTVEQYQEIIRLRGEHVAKLATTVDRLQVDLHNAKVEKELYQGINVMPSSDSEIEEKYAKLLGENVALKNKLSEKKTGLSDRERATYNSLRDEYSNLERKFEKLKELNHDLEIELAQKEELLIEATSTIDTPTVKDHGTFEEVDFNELPYISEDELLDTPDVKPNQGYSGAFVIDDDDDPFDLTNSSRKVNFIEEEENIIQQLSQNEQQPKKRQVSTVNILDDEDEDDELERMMKEWK